MMKYKRDTFEAGTLTKSSCQKVLAYFIGCHCIVDRSFIFPVEIYALYTAL